MVKQDEFTKLFKYMEKRFDEADAKTEALRSDMNERFERVEGMLEANIKHVDEKVAETEALTAQVDRHERYFGKVSNILEVDLDTV